MDEYVAMSEQMEAAKRRDDPAAVRRLLEQGEDPNAVDEDYDPLLGWAAWRGYKDLVRLLLDRGADIDTRGEEGETPLIHAAFHGHSEIVRLLIERGANVNLIERNHETAWSRARAQGHEQIATMLLAAGALKDAFATPEAQQRERERQGEHALELETARREFFSRAQTLEVTKPWFGAWGDPDGPGLTTYVFHSDGTVMCCQRDTVHEVAHLDDPGDGTLVYRLPNGKSTRIEKWSVSEDGKTLTFDYGNFAVKTKRL